MHTEINSLKSNYESNAHIILILKIHILVCVLCIFASFSEHTEEFCNTYSNVTDTSDMLGESGHIVRWLRVYVITSLILPLTYGIPWLYVKCVEICTTKNHTSSSMVHIFGSVCFYICHIFSIVWNIIGISIAFSNDIPVACKNYEMGNNLPFIVIMFISYLHIAEYFLFIMFLVFSSMIHFQ